MFFALSVAFSVCLRKCVWGRMLDLVFLCLCYVSSVVLIIVSFSFVECSAGCGVNSLVCAFEVLE